ncbi:MAG: hypothetical protein PQJ46_06130, partial [Spirochaetales bacterium]|nr:hypothetical protein [Spirochaetales bacterium]
MFSRKSVYIFSVLICLVIGSQYLYATGSKEDPYDTAENLYEQKEYNEAIKILVELLKNDPKQMERVQELLDKIRVAKKYYNDRYEDLIITYGGDDLELAYPIIKELEELDPTPNELTRDSLVLARETAGFVFNNNKWGSIMEEALTLIHQKQYSAAVETYMTGFDLSLDIFIDSGYGNVIVDDVLRKSEEMKTISSNIVDIYPEMEKSFEAVVSSFDNRDLSEYTQNLASALEFLEQSASYRESLKDIADSFIDQEKNIRDASGGDKQVYYLIYMDRLLNGR